MEGQWFGIFGLLVLLRSYSILIPDVGKPAVMAVPTFL